MDELKWAIQKMLEHHSEDQLPYLQEEDLALYYDIISVDTYFSNNTVVFILYFSILFSEFVQYFPKTSMQETRKTQDCVSQILQITNKMASCPRIPVTFNTTLIQEMSRLITCQYFQKPLRS